jgi:hypothetical protein
MSDTIDIVDRLRINWTSLTDNQNAERNEAADEIERLRAERDEARREIVLLLNGCCSWSKLTQEIKKRGWECLKEATRCSNG